MNPVPEYVNVTIRDLPIFTGCYKECKVSFFHHSTGTSAHTIISGEEAAFLRNLYLKHRESGMELPLDDAWLENKICSLEDKCLVIKMMKRVYLTKAALNSDYTFTAFPQL